RLGGVPPPLGLAPARHAAAAHGQAGVTIVSLSRPRGRGQPQLSSSGLSRGPISPQMPARLIAQTARQLSYVLQRPPTRKRRRLAATPSATTPAAPRPLAGAAQPMC